MPNALPGQLLISAKLENHRIEDVARETKSRVEALFSGNDLRGKRIAIGAGSRGIDQLATVVGMTVATLQSLGGKPFIFPAMGSHGGGTSEGQRGMLGSFLITEETMGVPIDASMETVELGRTASGIRLIASRPAIEADAMLFINRIKPHTDFASDRVGSGLRKMLAIGLGKIEGAFEYHRAAFQQGYESMILEVSDEILGRFPNVYAIGLVEDGYHHLARIEAMTGAGIVERESILLQQARDWMPRLPFREIDVLILDEMGKNISGAGMDPNVTGRGSNGRPRPNRHAEVGIIYVRGLTPESHGNAIGVGTADLVTTRLVEDIDKQMTYTNALSAMAPWSVQIPMHFATDTECMRAALRMSGVSPGKARVVRLRNTLALDRFVATGAYAGEIAARDDLTVLDSRDQWAFTAEGDFEACL
ncbi:MAG: lactate racemase domain-containing protein [Blastocatellia bacterium]